MPKGWRQGLIRELVEPGPAVDERMALRADADSRIVACYVLTRGAERALQAIHMQGAGERGALFWIGGPAGTGKTHLLNYMLALDRKTLASEMSERLTIALEIEGRPRGEDLERELLEALARELRAMQRDPMLWRQMRGAEALSLALDQARRLGIAALTLGVDFGSAPADSAFEYLDVIASACKLKQPKLIAIAAGRGRAPASAHAFEVAPEDARELVAAAIGRARRIKDEAGALVDDFYRGVDTAGFEPREIFPFHPTSIEVIRTIATPPGTVAETARLAGDVIAPCGERRLARYRRLIMPAELLNGPAVCARVEERLGESGRAALKIARAALKELSGDGRRLGEQIVDTLVLAHFGDGSPSIGIDQIRARLPHQFERAAARTWRQPRLGELLRILAERAKGVIRIDEDCARFEPRGAGAPEVAAFNAALALIRRLDPGITAAQDLAELEAKLKRLSEAMANALETAHRASELLAPALREAQGKLAAERQTSLADFKALVAGGPTALIEAAADPARCDEALRSVTAYETMAAAAAAAPRLNAMSEYLRATGLRWDCDDDQAKDGRIAALESQCQLLATQLNPAMLLRGAHNLDALQARFQQFRWAYVQAYRAAHERRRQEMAQLAGVVSDARRHVDALRRLNAISALGQPDGEASPGLLTDLASRIAPCSFEGPLAPEVSPRCPQCGFVLGTPSPERELRELLAQSKGALRRKLIALSGSTIARLIREHDRGRRLEGFLRITQAAQTEALVRVLDDKLAGYLARLIEENSALNGKAAAEGGNGAHGHPVLRRLHGRRPKAGAS